MLHTHDHSVMQNINEKIGNIRNFSRTFRDRIWFLCRTFYSDLNTSSSEPLTANKTAFLWLCPWELFDIEIITLMNKPQGMSTPVIWGKFPNIAEEWYKFTCDNGSDSFRIDKNKLFLFQCRLQRR